MLLLGVATYAAIFLLSPLEVLVDIETGSLVYIGLTIIALVLGSRCADSFRLMRAEIRMPAPKLERMENRLFWLMFCLGATGSAFKIVDKIVWRGVGNLTGLEARDALIDVAPSVFSLVGGVLYPFGYLPLFVLLGSRLLKSKRRHFLLAALLFLAPMADSLVLHSRSFMLVSLAMLYFGSSITLFRGRVLSPQIVVPFFAGVLIVVSLSMLLFLWRLDQMSLDLSDSVLHSAYAHTIVPNKSALNYINEGGPIVGLLPIAQYYLHSILEFQILWGLGETQVFSGGALHFSPYIKALGILGLASEPNHYDLFPRAGVFTSFWGPLWVDFGWTGPAVMFLFGFAARKIARIARGGNLQAYPLYTYLCVVLFFMPVINFAIYAQGMYVINAFILFWFIASKTSRAVPE